MRLSPQSLGFARGDTMRSTWHKIRKPLAVIAAIALLAGILMQLISIGYRVTWTGFFNKTLWDWLGLLASLAIPIVVAFGTLWFTTQQGKVSEAANERQHETELQIATDNQREAALQAYLDNMTALLLKKKLRGSQPEDEVRKVARVRTLTVLLRLDNPRKKSVLQFLHESGLIHKDKSIIILREADLRHIDLTFVILHNADLSFTNLAGANLFLADLAGANLNGTILEKASLFTTNLVGAKLSGADLSEANLRSAKLSGADLSGAILKNAILNEANLKNANLSEAFLVLADLSGADLSGADLSGANLSGATVLPEQLNKAKSLKGVIMPNSLTDPQVLKYAFPIIDKRSPYYHSIREHSIYDTNNEP